MKNLTHLLPTQNIEFWPEIFSDLTSANPRFDTAGKIGLMLGADVYAQIVLNGIRKENCLLAQNTIFGWIISGQVGANSYKNHLKCHHLTVEQSVDTALRRFWELEEVTISRAWTDEEVQCDKHYRETHRRNEEGRYVVR